MNCDDGGYNQPVTSYEHTCSKCSKPVRVYQVRKDTSKHRGRWFYSCGRDRGGCGAYKWVTIQDETVREEALQENGQSWPKKRKYEFFGPKSTGTGNSAQKVAENTQPEDAAGSDSTNSNANANDSQINETLNKILLTQQRDSETTAKLFQMVIAISNKMGALVSLESLSKQCAEKVLSTDSQEEDA